MSEAMLQPGWGVRPILFRLGGLAVPAYETFVLLGLVLGMWVYARESRRTDLGPNAWLLFAAALFGGVLGAKLPSWVTYGRQIAASGDPSLLISGRTIVGGLIGGCLAVIGARRYLGISVPSGNLFAPAAALALAVGRMGCFLRGCCYGTAAQVPWAVDFGDHIPRHPTQLYEAAFALLLFAWLRCQARREPPPGALFGQLMIGYFAFRFVVEFWRGEPHVVFGLTAAQLASLGVLAWYGAHRRRDAPVAPAGCRESR